jgi:hypothetical protein
MTNPRICRPKITSLKTKNNYFKPMKLLEFVTEICFFNHISANDFIIIFILYYIPEIIK